MMHTHNRQNHARHQVGFIMALIILISAATLATGPIRMSSAQADAPSWSYTGSPHMNGPASRVFSFNQPVVSQTTATTAAKAGWRFTNSMSTNRYDHTATRLEDGKVLIAGGGGFPCIGGYCYATVNRSSELYDPIKDIWSVTGELRQRRSGHTATLLKDGRVLIAGGADFGIDIGKFSVLDSAELYDPATGKWRPTASFNRIFGSPASATLLANGKVLAVGHSKPQGYSAELYDPVTETWSITAAPSLPGMSVLLPDGKVLTVSNNTPEIYDPATERWSSAGHLNVIGARTATLLTNGKVLATGTDESGLPGAELYDPSTGEWSVTGPPFAGLGTVTLLPEGRVLMSGDYTSQNLASGEIYDPDAGQWTLTDRLKAPRFAHTATLLVDGRVLVAGGSQDEEGFFILSSAELYGLIPIMKITSASVSGKKLFLSGENFRAGAVILLNDEEEKTINDDQTPSTMLIGKKAGKKIRVGDKLQVRNPDGTLSEEFIFTGS